MYTIDRWRALVLAGALFVITASSALAQPATLFTAPGRGFATGEVEQLDVYWAQEGVEDVTVVELALDPDEALAEALHINAPPALEVRLATDRVERRGPRDFSWFGGDVASGRWAVLVVKGDDMVGTIHLGPRQFAIRPVGGGLQAVLTLDPSVRHEVEPPGFPDALALTPGEDDPVAGDRGEVGTTTHCNLIDVIVAYTAAAKQAVGNAEAFIQQAVDVTNLSYGNSGVTPRLRLAHAYQTGAVETGDIWTDRDRFAAPNDGFADEVHSLRHAYAADVAVLLTKDQGRYCGLAYAIGATAGSAFAVVAEDCAVRDYTLAHEIGHLQGASHNPENADNPPYPYGHGYYYDADNWRTVMSYNRCFYASCQVIPYWSNPYVTYGGVPMGTTSTHHNARVLNERACTVAGFKTPVLPATPSSISVWSERCYGLNQVSWSSVFGASEYELWGSSSSNFSSSWRIYRGPSTSRSINVGGTTYLRVRACNIAGCGSYRTASSTAKYYYGCL